MTDHDTLLRLNEAYIRSVQRGDVAWFRENLSEDFYCSNPDASLVDKSAFLEQTARPVTIRGLAISDVKIRDLRAKLVARRVTCAAMVFSEPGYWHSAQHWRWRCSIWCRA